LMYVEWSVDAESPDDLDESLISDPEMWAQANPGLGIRISAEHIAREQRSMDSRTFAVERLGVGDWPDLNRLDKRGLDPALWAALADPDSIIEDPVYFAFDVRPDRSTSSICAAGRRSDGLAHVEVVDRRPGTGWLPERLAELVQNHETLGVICDKASPAASLVSKLANLGVEVEPVSASEHAQACGALFDAVDQKGIRHLGTPEMQAAVKGAIRRDLGDAWAWSRKSSAVDISPLVAGTLALWKVLPGSAAPSTPLVAWR
jgi:hypothetical protein